MQFFSGVPVTSPYRLGGSDIKIFTQDLAFFARSRRQHPSRRRTFTKSEVALIFRYGRNYPGLSHYEHKESGSAGMLPNKQSAQALELLGWFEKSHLQKSILFERQRVYRFLQTGVILKSTLRSSTRGIRLPKYT